MTDLLTGRVRSIGLVVAALAGTAAFYAHGRAAPRCESQPAMRQVYRILRDQFHLDGLFVNNAHPVSGWFFSGQRDCSAEITRIKGNVDASALTWREIRYSVEFRAEPAPPLVTLDLGNVVPLADPAMGFWDRLRWYL